MQHIINIAFDFDDDKVKQIAEKAVETELDKIVKDIVMERIAPMNTTWYSRTSERDWSKFEAKVNDRINEIVEESRERIIQLAAAKLVKSTMSTKAWKEKVKNLEVLADNTAP